MTVIGPRKRGETAYCCFAPFFRALQAALPPQRSAATRLRGCSRAAEGGRPKAFVAQRKSLQGRADLRAAEWPDPAEGWGSPKKKPFKIEGLNGLF